MKLLDWLVREKIPFAEFGTRIGRTGEAVRRYANGERVPDRATMPKIVRETRGEVTANDFFDGIDHILQSVAVGTLIVSLPSSGKTGELSARVSA